MIQLDPLCAFTRVVKLTNLEDLKMAQCLKERMDSTLSAKSLVKLFVL